MNYRGTKPANIIYVAEGDGTIDTPHTTTAYVVEYRQERGILRLFTVGKIVELTDEEKKYFHD